MFDPEQFGQAMGEAIRKAIQPLQEKIGRLEKDLEGMASQLQSEVHAFNSAESVPGPAGKDGKDCDMEVVKAMIEQAVKSIPIPKDGKDGIDGKDGEDGARGEKGADGLGLAGAMIDRDNNLQITLTNGEVKNLGVVVGKDGRDGQDGKDGISFESFEMEYIPETHEIGIKAVAGGRVKELRFPAGGIRHGGYWRDGVKSLAAQTWTHGGTVYIAKRDTSAKPQNGHEDWEVFARGGRDGERGPKGGDGTPPAPIKLGA